MGRPIGRGDGVSVDGFAQLLRALKRVDDGLFPELHSRLKAIGARVELVAAGNVTHRTGRSGSTPRIEDSIKVSVTQTSASVYSTAEHGGVQNYGGRVGHGAVIKRAAVSQYMTVAVKDTQPWVKEEMDGLISWLLTEFEK